MRFVHVLNLIEHINAWNAREPKDIRASVHSESPFWENIRKQSTMMRLSCMVKECLGRWILTPSGVVEGYLIVSGRQLVEVRTGRAPTDSSKALVLPGLVNAHTHVADSVAYPAPHGSVEELVAPPNGYKHKVLSNTSATKKSKAMRAAVQIMLRGGTTTFADFREEGGEGVQAPVEPR